MAFQAADGKKFTNRPPMMAHNRSIERNKGMESKADPLANPDSSEPDGDEQDGSAVAQEHGPAVEVNVMHDHEGGRHMVHSRHPDGHEHMSEHHASAGEAHDHAKKLAGGGHEEPDGDEMEDEPEYE